MDGEEEKQNAVRAGQLWNGFMFDRQWLGRVKLAQNVNLGQNTEQELEKAEAEVSKAKKCYADAQIEGKYWSDLYAAEREPSYKNWADYYKKLEDECGASLDAALKNIRSLRAKRANEAGGGQGKMFAPSGPAVASTDCSHLGPYAYWDGRQCRSSNMTQAAGDGLLNQAMNFGPSGAASVSPGNLQVSPSGWSATKFGGMGRRFPIVNFNLKI